MTAKVGDCFCVVTPGATTFEGRRDSAWAIVTSAAAQKKTRAQVRQELIEAESNGLNSVTDASSRDESTHFQRQVLSLLGVPEHAFRSPR